MGFSCDCDIDAPEFHHVRLVKARKPYICCECRDVIMSGSIYERSVGKWEGRISTHHTCERCADLRASYDAMGYCWYYGGLWDDHYDMIANKDSRAGRLAESILYRRKQSAA